MLTYRDLFDLSIGEGNLSHFFVYSILLSWDFKPLIFSMNQYINKDNKINHSPWFPVSCRFEKEKNANSEPSVKKTLVPAECYGKNQFRVNKCAKQFFYALNRKLYITEF